MGRHIDIEQKGCESVIRDHDHDLFSFGDQSYRQVQGSTG